MTEEKVHDSIFNGDLNCELYFNLKKSPKSAKVEKTHGNEFKFKFMEILKTNKNEICPLNVIKKYIMHEERKKKS